MIFFIILLLYSATLFRMSVPLTGDQKVYLSIALEMKEKSSFLIPYLFDHANFLKPPFQYWMTLLGWQVFGFNLFGALFPSVLALVVSAFLVKRLSPTQSNLSAIVFSSTLATMTYGTTAQMEIWIVAFYLGAWLFYEEKKLFWTFLTVGVMAWIKGPLYPVLFVLSVVGKETYAKNTKAFLNLKFASYLFMGTAIGLLWYLAASINHYQELHDVFFGRENFGKMQTVQGSPWGLWSEFLGTLFPVTFLFLASVLDPESSKRFQKQKLFWIAYALLPALFFTFFPYRVNNYLYFLTPLISWLVFENPNPKKWIRLSIFSLTLCFSAAASVLLYRLASGTWIGVPLAFAMAIACWSWSYGHWRLKGKWIAVSALVLVCLIRWGASDIGEWDLRPLRDTSPARYAYLIEANQEDVWHEFGLISTALSQSISRVKNESEARSFLEQGGSLILSDEQTSFSNSHCEPWRRLKRRIKFPIRKLLLEGLSIEDPELHRNFQICTLSK